MFHLVWSGKALVLYLGIFLSIEIIYFVQYYEDTDYMSNQGKPTVPDLWLTQRAHMTQNVTEKLKENSCKFPVYNPFEPTLLKYFKPFTANCTKHKTYFKSYGDDGNPAILMTTVLPKKLKCCFEVLRFSNVGNFTQYKTSTDKCIFLKRNYTSLSPEAEYVVVNCWDTKIWKLNRNFKASNFSKLYMKPTHRELLFFVPKPSNLNVSKDKLTENDHNEFKLNVIIIGYDQISRLNFIRLMSRSFDYLKNDLEAIDLQGFTKIGDATLNNTLALLTGYDYAGIKKAGWWTNESDTFDECPWIWKNFSNNGYVTDYADDYDSVFNYRFKGFRQQPTDYYMQPFARNFMTNLRQFGSNRCIGKKRAVELLLDRARNVAKTLKNYRYFQFLWGSRVHEIPGYPYSVDASTLQTLQYFKETQIFNKSIVVMVSDHGWRAGSIMMNSQARTENRLPFAFLILPNWFRDQYPVAYRNLVENQYRLTTPYDLHATLLDILNLKSLQTPSLLEQRSASEEIMSKAVSLFLPVPKNRTCQMAKIDAMWCACGVYHTVSVKSPLTIRLAKFAVNTLNSWLKSFRQCYKYVLAEVISAEVQKPTSSNKDGFINDHIFRLVINVNPRHAKFEVVVFWNGHDINNSTTAEGSMKMSTEVFRLNRYETSNCIDVYLMKKICTCKFNRG